ncbi:MAG TPA: RND transporter [Gammaproteobacteria bacterium]|nr:RND transporter [Gammaproteobacteria bacterium]
MRWIQSLSWPMVIFFSLTLGLAPFNPEPHVLEKITMLLNGELTKPIDMFDLMLHGTPWILLIIKSSTLFLKQPENET